MSEDRVTRRVCHVMPPVRRIPSQLTLILHKDVSKRAPPRTHSADMAISHRSLGGDGYFFRGGGRTARLAGSEDLPGKRRGRFPILDYDFAIHEHMGNPSRRDRAPPIAARKII